MPIITARSRPLAEVPEEKGVACQPVWVTIAVPRDASPGTYLGRVRFKADGLAAVEATCRLVVVAWTLPDPRDLASHAGVVQSPDSVAARYGVEPWSEAHGHLVKRSFEWPGQLGADDLFIPLIRRTHLGNEHSMVRWIRGEDGSLRHDLRLAE